MENFLLNPFYLEDTTLKTCTSEGMISMEEFFLRLGLMTQKNQTELMQTVNGLRVSIESLTTEIAKLNSQVTESHMDLSDKISSLIDATKNLSAHITENFSKIETEQVNLDKKFSYLKEGMINNQSALEERFATLTKATNDSRSALEEKFATLTKATNDNQSALEEKFATFMMAISDNQSALEEKFSALDEISIANNAEIKNLLITITDKLYVFADTYASDHAAFYKKISTLASQTTNDNNAVKKSLENVEELLRLTAANQIMNLIEK